MDSKLAKADPNSISSSVVEAFRHSELGLFLLFLIVIFLVVIYSPPFKRFVEEIDESVKSIRELIEVVRRLTNEIVEASRDRNAKHAELIEELNRLKRAIRRLSAAEDDYDSGR